MLRRKGPDGIPAASWNGYVWKKYECEKFGMHTINRDTIVRYKNKHANN